MHGLQEPVGEGIFAVNNHTIHKVNENSLSVLY